MKVWSAETITAVEGHTDITATGEGMEGSCARQTGEGWPVKVRRKEGITNHLHPESCAGRCEAAGEALTGARTGGAIEHRKDPSSGAPRL